MIHRISWYAASAIAGALLLFGASTAWPRELTLRDLRREITLADPQISPDGAHVALLVATSDFRNNAVHVRIDMVDTRSGAAHTLVLPFDNFAGVRWSPDGEAIAFAAARGSGTLQLYESSPEGAGLRPLTRGSSDVQYFAWRPDGRALAFVRSDPPPAASGAARFRTSFTVGDNGYLATSAPLPSHLWLVTAPALGSETGAREQRLTRGSFSLPPASFGLSQPYVNAFIEPQHMPSSYFCWYGDSRHIGLTAMPDPYIAHDDQAVMEVLDTAAPLGAPSALQKLTSHTGLEAGCDVSPDGSKLAYWYPSAGNALNASAIFVTDAAARGPSGLDVTRELDRSPWVVRWMPDDLSLLILAHDGTTEGMWIVGLDGSVRRLDIGNLCASGASVSANGAIAFIASGPQTPTELYLMPSPAAQPRRLSAYNRFFWTLHLGAVHHVTWTLDGFKESGVLTYPPDFVAGRRYPLVLQIHGWPQYASQEAFDTDYPGLTQLLAAHGYLVFEPNYRGSDNAGNAFETAIVGDTVAGPGRDILAGIVAVEKLGIVDSSKIGISGWSYGGLMTAWLITQDHRWKAAMTGAAPTDLAVDYAIGDYNVLDRFYYGAALWSSKAAYRTYVEQSPITYAWNITTPTLIMASVFDPTVPITHSYELYHALRDRGVPVQFIAYNSSAHYPGDPISSEDIYRRWVGWFDRWLR